jgi:hypothetical protein
LVAAPRSLESYCWSALCQDLGRVVFSAVDFFICGYPKCGTTALYTFLRGNTAVFLPDLKEPHYFTTDYPGARVILSMNDYRRLYRNADPTQLKGDASASVIHSLVAVDNILCKFPQAKFIVLLREPVAAVLSFHSELLYNLNEDVRDFEKAWRLQKKRAVGECIPRTCIEPAFLQYANIFHYRSQLRDLLEKVPSKNRIVLVFEEFFLEPREGYLRILEFLNLEDDGRTQFPKLNSSRQLRIRWISRLHRRIVSSNGPLYHNTRVLLSCLGIHPSDILERFNRKRGFKAIVLPDFQRELREHFKPDIEAAEQALGRTIEAWKV